MDTKREEALRQQLEHWRGYIGIRGELSAYVLDLMDRQAKLQAVAKAADRLCDCLAEFGDDAPMACGEYVDALETALGKGR